MNLLVHIKLIRIFGSANTPQTISQSPENDLHTLVGWIYIVEF